MRIPRVVALVMFCLLLGLAVGTAAAQPGPDYIKITPPPGMRWKTLDQSGVTKDIFVVDKPGDTWLKKAAAASFATLLCLSNWSPTRPAPTTCHALWDSSPMWIGNTT